MIISGTYMMKAFFMLALCLIVAQTVLAQVKYKEVRTPDGVAYTGTFNSNGASGGFGGGYSSGGFSGGYGGSVNGYPYGGTVSSRGGFGGGGGAFPDYDSFVNPSEFERLITGQLNALQRGYASGISMIHATPGASAYASTSLTNNHNLYKNHLQQEQDLFNTIRQQAQTAGAGSNYASASGSYGPQGIHQTAAVYPQNSNSPNVDTRFAAEGAGDGKPGFWGISSSSFYDSSNINGVPKERKGAITTVNDNGKITTYKAGF